MTQTAKTYAQALFGICAQENSADETLAALKAVRDQMRAVDGYAQMLSSPALPKAERIDMMQRAFADTAPDNVIGFLRVLIRHGHMNALDACIDAFSDLNDAAHGIVTAKVVSAVPLSDSERKALAERLSARTGHTIRLDAHVDPELIGGVRVFVDGKVFDGSIRRRLNELKDVMKK